MVQTKTKRIPETDEQKARRRQRESTPEYKAKRKARESTPEFKAKKRIWEKNYRKKPERKAQRSQYHKNLRIKVLIHYSKSLSNGDIPCCNCCGENFHVDFLALDHIAGRRQMDSEPELVKLGYSSKLDSHELNHWIIRNNFPDGFQVLCHNCNFAKGMKKNNNQCPHEKARKEEI